MNLYCTIKPRYLFSINPAVSAKDKEISSCSEEKKKVESDGNVRLPTKGLSLIRSGKCLYT